MNNSNEKPRKHISGTEEGNVFTPDAFKRAPANGGSKSEKASVTHITEYNRKASIVRELEKAIDNLNVDFEDSAIFTPAQYDKFERFVLEALRSLTPEDKHRAAGIGIGIHGATDEKTGKACIKIGKWEGTAWNYNATIPMDLESGDTERLVIIIHRILARWTGPRLR